MQKSEEQGRADGERGNVNSKTVMGEKNKTKFLPWKVPAASNRIENVGTKV